MAWIQRERIKTAELPASSVVTVLVGQHADIRALFDRTERARGTARQEAFDQLRELLAVHEAGEELVLRPLSRRAFSGAIARARNAEEKKAAALLADLAELDVASRAFTLGLLALEQAVCAHADAEESMEFPFILATIDREEQCRLGTRLLTAQDTFRRAAG